LFAENEGKWGKFAPICTQNAPTLHTIFPTRIESLTFHTLLLKNSLMRWTPHCRND